MHCCVVAYKHFPVRNVDPSVGKESDESFYNLPLYEQPRHVADLNETSYLIYKVVGY